MGALKNVALIILWGMFAVGLLGCAGADGTNAPARIDIDSRFIEFYNLMGGERTLGTALGPAFQRDGKILQYTENALMVYDESKPVGDRFNFEPLGISFQVSDLPLPAPENQPETRFINGYIIPPEFVTLFDQLGGVRFAGYPLTQVRWNPEKSRYEQYFEKIGLYHREGETSVYLLPYGLVSCRRRQAEPGCSATTADAIIGAEYLPQPFLPIIKRLGQDFTGAPLSEPYRAADGMLEQVYENVVLAVDPGNLRTIGLRPLPLLTGYQPGPLVPPSSDQRMVFIMLDPVSGLGHNVPKLFIEYIASHGGAELSGNPIGELFEENGMPRQCFQNYCLDFDPSAPAGAQIRPASLGRTYLRGQNYQPAQIGLLAWETNSHLSPGQEQVLGVRVYHDASGQPMQDVEPTVEITLPNGTVKKLVFPPTSSAGNTYLGVNLPGLKTGDLITYKVCVSQPGGAPVCVSDSWLAR